MTADPTAGTVAQVPGISTKIDSSHATEDVASRLAGFFTAKSAHDVEATMEYFSRDTLSYLDATVEMASQGWEGLHGAYGHFMPNWAPDVKAYATRIVGDSSGALVMCVDTPGAFGPGEIRVAATIDFRDDKIVRWVDYWDGRHFGVDHLAAARVGDPEFATHLRDSATTEAAAPELRRVAQELTDALVAGDSKAATALFAPDAVFEDLVAHLRIEGPISIERFLERAAGHLPYMHKDTQLLHVVGGAQGGGYEWTTPGPVLWGLTALELDGDARITRLSAMWDGSAVDEDFLLEAARQAVEA